MTEQQDAGQPTAEAQPTSEGAPSGAQQQPEEKSFSQADVNKIMGDVRNDATGTVLKQLGYDDLDALKADVGTFRQQREDAKSDLQKAQEAQTTLQAENDQLYARIAETEMRSTLRDALTEAGVNPQRMVAAMRLADLDALDIDDKGNVTGADEQIAAIQEAAPEFFGQTFGQMRRAPDLSGGGGSSTGQPQSEDAFNAQLRRMGMGGT